MNEEYQIEIDLKDALRMTEQLLIQTQRALAIEYAKVESLKRKIADLEAHAKAAAPAAGQ